MAGWGSSSVEEPWSGRQKAWGSDLSTQQRKVHSKLYCVCPVEHLHCRCKRKAEGGGRGEAGAWGKLEGKEEEKGFCWQLLTYRNQLLSVFPKHIRHTQLPNKGRVNQTADLTSERSPLACLAIMTNQIWLSTWISENSLLVISVQLALHIPVAWLHSQKLSTREIRARLVQLSIKDLTLLSTVVC